MRRPWDCLRAFTKPGMASAASNPMMATTIMISTRGKPAWLLRCVLLMYVFLRCTVVCFVTVFEISTPDAIAWRHRKLQNRSLPFRQLFDHVLGTNYPM